MQGTLGSLDSLKGVPLHLALELHRRRPGRLRRVRDADPHQPDAARAVRHGPTSRWPSRSTSSGSACSAPTARRRSPPTRCPLVRARRGEFVRDAVVTTRRADGTLVHLKCNAVPLRDDDGSDIGAIALVQDVTAETQASLRAEALQQAAGRDDQPRVPYAARGAARARRADPRPPGPSRGPRPGAGRLAGRHRAVRLAAARPRPGGGGAGQPRRARGAGRPPAAPDARGLTLRRRRRARPRASRPRRSSPTPPAAAPRGPSRSASGSGPPRPPRRSARPW